MARPEEASEYARRMQARMRAKAIGLDPNDLDFDAAEEDRCFNPNGTPKSVEVSALLNLIAKRWHEQRKAAAKRPNNTGTRSRSTV